jgi:hypothetical protein
MRYAPFPGPKNLWLAVVFITLIGFPMAAKGGAVTEPGGKKAPAAAPHAYPKVAIASIWQNPAAWEGRKIYLEAKFLGWQGGAKHPGITKSDWAIEDGTGAIYVTGRRPPGLDPLADVGRRLQVWGTVKVNPQGIPYIVVARVVVSPE